VNETEFLTPTKGNGFQIFCNYNDGLGRKHMLVCEWMFVEKTATSTTQCSTGFLQNAKYCVLLE
jgi:hypothetical protein